MGNSIATVTIVGHVGSASLKEIVDKTTGEVTNIINFSVAVNRTEKEQEIVDWYECSMYNRKGFDVAWLTKGKQVMVQGGLSFQTYETKQGTAGFAIKVRVNDLVLLGKKEAP